MPEVWSRVATLAAQAGGALRSSRLGVLHPAGRREVKHVMRVARPSAKIAKRCGLNPNHHVRVWCECMAQQKSTPGELPSGLYWTGRPSREVASDPRRLGGWDCLGVVDNRNPGSALDLFREHLREAS